MKLIDVNQSVELFDRVYRLLEEKQANYVMDHLLLDRKYDDDKKNLENRKQDLIENKNKDLANTIYLSKVIDEAARDYQGVIEYLWVICGGLIVLTFLLIYFLGLSLWVLFFLGCIAATYFAGRDLNDHTTSLKSRGVWSVSSVNPHNNYRLPEPPFFYKWFKRPTLSDREAIATAKYQSEKTNHYNNLISVCESDIQLNHQRYQADKLALNNKMNSDFDFIIQTNRPKLESAKRLLNQVHQTSSSVDSLKINGTICDTSNLTFSQNYIFTHYKKIRIRDVDYSFSAFLSCGSNRNIFINGHAQNKAVIKDIVTDIILKNLLGIKLTKLKLMMYDPVELGAFFSDFHKLHKEVSGGVVYNTGNDLNDILDSSLRHIAMVVQKILTNRYNTLDDFNEQNPELAEPYKLLIINDFPRSFDNYQLNKLKQILTLGPKCGVYSIIVGENGEIADMDLSSIEASSFIPVFKSIDIDQLIQEINVGIIAAGNIEIELNKILMNDPGWWTNDSSECLDIPIGKRGKDTQSLKFDNMDDNQALMIGKPGSGKSNLLHVIILSALTKYGPHDLEVYLIDFKGGVEFMPYTEYQIPHLRTVAVETDREFGLSVIDGVEKELLRRETLFRNAGVQNIEQYNRTFPDKKISRILFIVDEFQEFFKIDDDLKYQVSLKYDTIIRKGRAFGINSLFSSQTLEGHSIPRATKDLIDIRIALMCGDYDVKEIMDDKNLSAKDLSRPGEAIYNAENGKSAGNQRFQAVFVERNQISEIIKKVSEKPLPFGFALRDRFVFRGDISATLQKINHPLNKSELLQFKPIRVWLGEPVSMDPDYFTDIRQASAQNMLIVGNNSEGAGVFSSLVFSLKKQSEKIESIYMINALSDDDEGLEEYAAAYGETSLYKEYRPSQIKELLEQVNELIIQRKEKRETGKRIFCMFNSVHKISQLRDSEIGRKFIELMKECSEYGIHFIVHIDSVFNLKRTELGGRSSLIAFNHRIAFQLSEDAYYDLIGNNRIKQLKNNRMVYYSDEIGRYNIIKPYELIDNR
jgi:S-DNA-T family DNA segregation ATPase FtsK/SpoIIIE